ACRKRHPPAAVVVTSQPGRRHVAKPGTDERRRHRRGQQEAREPHRVPEIAGEAPLDRPSAGSNRSAVDLIPKFPCTPSSAYATATLPEVRSVLSTVADRP